MNKLDIPNNDTRQEIESGSKLSAARRVSSLLQAPNQLYKVEEMKTNISKQYVNLDVSEYIQ